MQGGPANSYSTCSTPETRYTRAPEPEPAARRSTCHTSLQPPSCMHRHSTLIARCRDRTRLASETRCPRLYSMRNTRYSVPQHSPETYLATRTRQRPALPRGTHAVSAPPAPSAASQTAPLCRAPCKLHRMSISALWSGNFWPAAQRHHGAREAPGPAHRTTESERELRFESLGLEHDTI